MDESARIEKSVEDFRIWEIKTYGLDYVKKQRSKMLRRAKRILGTGSNEPMPATCRKEEAHGE
jgi:hypothetical protein